MPILKKISPKTYMLDDQPFEFGKSQLITSDQTNDVDFIETIIKSFFEIQLGIAACINGNDTLIWCVNDDGEKVKSMATKIFSTVNILYDIGNKMIAIYVKGVNEQVEACFLKLKSSGEINKYINHFYGNYSDEIFTEDSIMEIIDIDRIDKNCNEFLEFKNDQYISYLFSVRKMFGVSMFVNVSKIKLCELSQDKYINYLANLADRIYLIITVFDQSGTSSHSKNLVLK